MKARLYSMINTLNKVSATQKTESSNFFWNSSPLEISTLSYKVRIGSGSDRIHVAVIRESGRSRFRLVLIVIFQAQMGDQFLAPQVAESVF